MEAGPNQKTCTVSLNIMTCCVNNLLLSRFTRPLQTVKLKLIIISPPVDSLPKDIRTLGLHKDLMTAEAVDVDPICIPIFRIYQI